MSGGGSLLSCGAPEGVFVSPSLSVSSLHVKHLSYSVMKRENCIYFSDKTQHLRRMEDVGGKIDNYNFLIALT